MYRKLIRYFAQKHQKKNALKDCFKYKLCWCYLCKKTWQWYKEENYIKLEI